VLGAQADAVVKFRSVRKGTERQPRGEIARRFFNFSITELSPIGPDQIVRLSL
jgi:hypothetical protein